MCPDHRKNVLYISKVSKFLCFRALEDCMITEEQMGSYDPVLMLAIPRLAIIWYQFMVHFIIILFTVRVFKF